MITDSPPRRRLAGLLTALAVAAGLVAVPAVAASAAGGAAPDPTVFTVIDNVHTDAVSTFLDDGRLTLATKADVPEHGTRYAADSVWFRVNDHAKLALPTATSDYDFIAPRGSTVWVAPMTQDMDVIWPGFSTESIPKGALDDDRITFTLEDVTGPGDVEVYLGTSFGGVGERLWSSDDGPSSFTRGVGVHMHANWAFTAAGTYTLKVRADARRTGAAVSDTAAYTFIVGDLPKDVATTTTLAVDRTTAVQGERVTLTAAVAPAVDGYVEFRDGETVLGHEKVVKGSASFATSGLKLGTRSLTARYVPAVENLSNASTSAAKTVTVTEEAGGDVFGVTGLKERYEPGEKIDLRVAGATLQGTQAFKWIVAPAQQPFPFGRGTGDRLSLEATQAYDGAQVWVYLLPTPTSAPLNALQQTAKYTIHVNGVGGSTGERITLSGLEGDHYAGDAVSVTVDHRPLADGETGAWVSRAVPTGTAWTPATDVTGTNPYIFSTALEGMDGLLKNEYAYRITAADGTVRGQSAAIQPRIQKRDLTLSGMLDIYRAGQHITATANLFPARDGVRYEWSVGTTALDETGATLDAEVQDGWDGASLDVRAVDAGTGEPIASASAPLLVTAANPDERILLMGKLGSHGDHYHSNDVIALHAYPSPAAASTDTFQWFWKVAGADWEPIEGATAASYDGLRGEQALQGTQIRVEHYDEAGKLLAGSDADEIHIDDHGLPAPQRITIAGAAESYAVGARATLTAGIRPATVLDTYQWFAKAPGQSEAAPIEGATSAVYGFAATAAMDGTELTAAVVMPDGRLVYGPSEPVTLHVDASAEPTPDPGETPGPGTTPTPDPTPGVTPAPGPTPSATPAPGAPSAPQPKPASAPQARTGDDLAGVDAGGIALAESTLRAGQTVTIDVGAAHAREWVAAWMFSTPTLLDGGWTQADANGVLSVRIPADAPAGAHRIAVFDSDGALIGWSAVTVAGAQPAASGILPVTGGGALSPAWAWASLLLIGAGAGVLVLTRRRRRVER